MQAVAAYIVCIILSAMQSLVLFEDEGFVNLLPLLWWRTVFELRLGRRIVLDRIPQCLGLPVSGVWTRDWITEVAALRCGAPANQSISASTVLANGRWVCGLTPNLPEQACVGTIEDEIAYIVCDARLANQLKPADLLDHGRRWSALDGVPRKEASGHLIRYPWDLLTLLPDSLAEEWEASDATIETELDPRVMLGGREQVHVGERARIHPTAVIDATAGPIFISHDVEIGAHSVIEGPLYMGPGSRINPHAWLHGASAIGPVCRLGGEIDGCIIHGYTNKQHSGFLGHAVVGSWVNIGAGATNSDLKNTYGSVRVPINGVNVDSRQMFFGAVIGDHAKLGINATLPTGAVVGFAALAAATRVLPKYIPSFGWVTDDATRVGDAPRLLDAATRMMVRRQIDMTDSEVELFLDLESRVNEHEARSRSHD